MNAEGSSMMPDLLAVIFFVVMLQSTQQNLFYTVNIHSKQPIYQSWHSVTRTSWRLHHSACSWSECYAWASEHRSTCCNSLLLSSPTPGCTVAIKHRGKQQLSPEQRERGLSPALLPPHYLVNVPGSLPSRCKLRGVQHRVLSLVIVPSFTIFCL